MQHYDPANKRMTFRLANSGDSELLPVGSGPVLHLHFEVIGSMVVGKIAPIVMDGYSTHFPDFDGPIANYRPIIRNGAVATTTCCEGIRGNIDEDPAEKINIVGLIYLVNYIFNDGVEPPCLYEANIDGDILGWINITDLIYLVNYMFNDDVVPAACP